MDDSINRVVLAGASSEAPAVPDAFRERLRQYDPTLLVSWNAWKKRFVIEQCTEHLSATAEHTHICRRIYVCLAQDSDGYMIPLGDRVIEMIAERDTQRAGYGPNDLAKWIRDNRAKRREHYEKIDQAMSGTMHDATKDGRRQLLKAAHLVQQHNLDVNR